MAQDNVRRRLSADSVSKQFKTTTPATAKAGLPVITSDAGVTLHLNGDDLVVVHVPHAHTDGDAMIYWRAANVLHTGDIFFNKETFPFIDLESGGSIDGMIAGANAGLKLVKPGGKIIPGHGPIASRADLQAYRDMLVDVRAKVAAAIRAGKSRAQVIAMHPATPYVGWVKEGFITSDDFAGEIYDSLKGAR